MRFSAAFDLVLAWFWHPLEEDAKGSKTRWRGLMARTGAHVGASLRCRCRKRIMKQAWRYFGLGMRLILGNAIIVVVMGGIYAVYGRITFDARIQPSYEFIIFILASIPIGFFIHWVRSGSAYRNRRISVLLLAVNLLLAEIWPVLIGLYLIQLLPHESPSYVILGMGIDVLFAIGMPLVVVISSLSR
jgi:hypothetical protein